MTSTEVSCRHARQKTEVWSVAWTYAFCNRPIACRTGQVAKGNVRIRQRCPRAQGYVQMSRCAALCVRSGLAAILSGKRPRAHLYIESVLAIDPSIHRWFSLQVLLRSADACSIGRAASKRHQCSVAGSARKRQPGLFPV